MTGNDDWTALLDKHPIFSRSKPFIKDESFELSLDSIPDFTKNGDLDENTTFSGRRQVMCMKDADLLLASGSEVRMASLGDAKMSGGSSRSYKILHTPNIDFDIQQICLNPNRKLLAVAGVYQVAIIALPSGGFSKLVNARIDCKSLRIGKDYHSSDSSPIAKVDWHPWGETGSTLLVMTTDGKLREYDVSLDPDEPCKVVDFVPPRKSGSFAADDDLEREVSSFTFGKGKADWGPLTIYASMKSGDVYAMCPYLPERASVPASYIHSLECYVAAKQEFLNENGIDIDEAFSSLYDLQRKYVNGLLKQFPPGMSNPLSSSAQFISLHPPKSFTSKPAKQGPFLLQPSPSELPNSPGAEATDIAYVTLGNAFSEDDDTSEQSLTSERLGVLVIAYQDGRVDVCLDLEKIEAKWESKTSSKDLPMLAVYEVIDLGIISSLSRSSPNVQKQTLLPLVQGNHPVLHPDPIHDDTLYIYHAFGVHVLNFNPVLQHFALALKEDNDESLSAAVQKSGNTSVQAILSTFSVEKRSSIPIIAVSVPSDVYLTYSIFILTSTQRLITFPLNLRTESLDLVPSTSVSSTVIESSLLPPLPESASQKSIPATILQEKPFEIPAILNRKMGLPSIAHLALPKSHGMKEELRVTPETLRYLASVVEKITSEIHDVQLAFRSLTFRHDLQRQEYARQQQTCRDMVGRIEKLNGSGKAGLEAKMGAVKESQAQLLSRMDRVLQALINRASPELNEHETKWFEELQRMKAQVLGVGRYDEMALKTRVQMLKKEFDRISPTLQALQKKETERKKRRKEPEGAGFPYTDAYERLSMSERQKLESAMKNLVKLAGKLEISTLGAPPGS
ncbi:hypothetical protein SCHPADRAFT_864426 [Schizopora paradoxa]|uniref:Nucleoporin Nup82 n=1 Tax=Schizopora paradoxa TaxID=27342 RepID=A0A0H2S6B6_9AGAM|nr:hypothetical protein SCHPADRAFT_864426 [Schizopora paradoxa]